MELRDGQSFAIAGLLNNLAQDDGANIPFLSKIPIIGYLFKSKAERLERTELMVLVTPRLVQPLDPDEVPPLPTQQKHFLPAPGRRRRTRPDGASPSGRPQVAARRHGDDCDDEPSTIGRAGDERGAVLVHVAVAMLALLAFSALVIDYGALWVSRRQAQNAADAAALAGALSLAFDDPDDIPRAQAGAAAAGVANQVWGAAPSILPATDVLLVPCPPGAPGLPDTCIRANVYRSAARVERAPDVLRADRRHQQPGRARDGHRPGAHGQRGGVHEAVGRCGQVGRELGERRAEHGSVDARRPTSTNTEDRATLRARSRGDDAGRVHRANGQQIPGPGSRRSMRMAIRRRDYGLQLTLKIGSSENRLSSGWFLGARSAQPGRSSRFGRPDYRNNITNCNGDRLPDWRHAERATPRQGEHGRPDQAGCRRRRAGRTWASSEGPRRILERRHEIGSGELRAGRLRRRQYYARSPRIVPVPLFDIDDFFAGSPNGKTTRDHHEHHGLLHRGHVRPGQQGRLRPAGRHPRVDRGGGSVDESASFLRKVSVGAVSETHMTARLVPDVLVVDPLDRELEQLLSASGMRTTRASAAELAALVHAAAQLPHVVIVDTRGSRAIPPSMAAVKRQHPGVGFLVVASESDPALLLEAMRAGATEFLQEPITAAALVAGDLPPRRAPRQRAAGSGEVFAFVGAKGGVGTTTAAVNVATALAKLRAVADAARGPAPGARRRGAPVRRRAALLDRRCAGEHRTASTRRSSAGW